jgi:hypothetical protein
MGTTITNSLASNSRPGSTSSTTTSRGNFPSCDKNNQQSSIELHKSVIRFKTIASGRSNNTLRRDDNPGRNDSNLCTITENIELIESSKIVTMKNEPKGLKSRNNPFDVFIFVLSFIWSILMFWIP